MNQQLKFGSIAIITLQKMMGGSNYDFGAYKSVRILKTAWAVISLEALFTRLNLLFIRLVTMQCDSVFHLLRYEKLEHKFTPLTHLF